RPPGTGWQRPRRAPCWSSSSRVGGSSGPGPGVRPPHAGPGVVVMEAERPSVAGGVLDGSGEAELHVERGVDLEAADGGADGVGGGDLEADVGELLAVGAEVDAFLGAEAEAGDAGLGADEEGGLEVLAGALGEPELGEGADAGLGDLELDVLAVEGQ